MPTLYDNFSQVKQYIDQEKPDLTSYVTKTELANCSYVTSADLPVINESIIPKENATYTLGDSSYIYSATYTDAVYVNTNNKIYNTAGGGMRVQRGSTDICAFLGGANLGISPVSNNTGSLGNTDQRWKNLWVNNAYISNYNNFIWTGTQAEYELLPDYTTYQFYLISENE